MIKRQGSQWVLMSHDGSKKLGGPYKTREEAVEREREVKFFANKGKANGKRKK